MPLHYGAKSNLYDLISTHLFIICPNNSGSTYLKRVLATSNNTWNLSKEGQHMIGFSGPSSRKITNGKLWATEPWLKTFNDESAFDWSKTRKAWYFQAYSNNPNASVFVEKSPPFLLHVKKLQIYFKRARFLIMVRNPYAVVEGIRRRRQHVYRKKNSNNYILEQAAVHIMNCFKYQRDNIENYSDVSTFFSYEDMCEKHNHIESLIKSLIPELNDITIKQKIWVKDYNEMLRNMNEQQISRLDSDDLAVINKVFTVNSDLLKYFGYNLLK